ncbi:hypothetical protein TNCV_4056361 [Trichonephila clavipes]|nr:hypothetical protein TNCV_4056361 [Trichonephila clavipes]
MAHLLPPITLSLRIKLQLWQPHLQLLPQEHSRSLAPTLLLKMALKTKRVVSNGYLATVAFLGMSRWIILQKNLRASVYPEKLIVKEGISVTFTCNVTGPQITSLVWTKNLKPVITSARTKLISSEVLQIYSVMREDKGMYQCFVRSHDYSYQGSAQLSLEVLKTNVKTMKQLHCLTIGEADKELTNKQGGHEIPRGNKAPEFHYRE